MKVTAIKPRGYCFGVVNALNVVKQAIKENPKEQIYILGIIIHNKFVKEALDQLGVISIYDPTKTKMELLETIDSGVIIFTAHGTAFDVIERAYEKGLKVYNAVCRDVTKTQDIVKDYLKSGYDILYIGKHNHPESEAMIAISENIKLITSLEDINDLVIKDKTVVTNQTTMSIYDTQYLVDEITSKNSNVVIIDEICNATKMRQEALFDLSEFDLVYVVGDKLSNNSNNLANVARRSINNVRFIESVIDINEEDLNDIKTIAVTSGASTPHSITEQVIGYLKKYPNVNDEDRTIDYSKIL